MDLVYKKYASPFSLLDNLIVNEQFNEWVEHFSNKSAKEKDDKMLWEFFLHKVHDKSFTDWKAEMKGESSPEHGAMEEAEKEKIIADSRSILNGFSPTSN
ncbi:MAG: hypothetical protein ACERKZ_02460 [Lachnotalea sp.]